MFVYKVLIAIVVLAMSLSAVRVSSRTSVPTAAVIVFHGLGDTGQGWKFLADIAQRSSDYNHIRFVFPNAPVIPITANGGQRMPGWFDILAFGGVVKDQDVPGYLRALSSVDKYVDEIINSGIPSERIIIGGFSQGGALALGKLADSKSKFAGFLEFSPFVFPFQEVLKAKHTGVNIETPVFHGHGEEDPLIHKSLSDSSAKFFKEELGYKNYEYRTYPGVGHSLAEDELEYALNFIKERLPSK
jgi:phospholipase/carboxylesterase